GASLRSAQVLLERQGTRSPRTPGSNGGGTRASGTDDAHTNARNAPVAVPAAGGVGSKLRPAARRCAGGCGPGLASGAPDAAGERAAADRGGRDRATPRRISADAR